jgi:signal peptidase II
MTSARRNDLLMVGTGLLVIVLDQLTKHWVLQYFAAGTVRAPIQLLGPVLQLQYLANTGAAFSLFEGQTILFVFIGLAIAMIAVLYWRTRETASWLLKLTFGLILGGAIGNLIDRFTHTYVVDFIHFQIPHVFDWPVFNVADSAISVGVVLLAYLLWRSDTVRAVAREDAPHTSAPPAERAAPRPGKATSKP